MNTLGGGTSYTGNDKVGDAHVLELLPTYAASVTLGQAAEARFPQVAQHLDQCLECQAELTRLLQLLEPLYDGTLEPEENVQSFDLSFLTASATSTPLSESEAPAVLSKLSGSLNRLVLVLDTQLEALRNQWSAAFGRPMLLRARGRPLIDYEPDPATTGGVSVSVQIYPSDANPQSCDLQLAVVLPEGVQAPNGIALALEVDDRVWKETTDESGLFIFAAAVSLDATKLRITAEVLPSE